MTKEDAAARFYAAAEALAKAATDCADHGLTIDIEFDETDVSTIAARRIRFRSRCRVAEVTVREFPPR